MTPASRNKGEQIGKVVALCGMPGSGKGEFTDNAISMDIPVFSMGDVVRETFKKQCPDSDPSETGEFADQQRREHGDDIWAKRLMDKINREAAGGLVLIDGLRSRYESELFSTEWGDKYIVLAIHSSPSTRYNRLKNRGREDDPSSRGQFYIRDLRELKWGLGDVIALADVMVLNEGTVTDIREKGREMLELLRWTK